MTKLTTISMRFAVLYLQHETMVGARCDPAKGVERRSGRGFCSSEYFTTEFYFYNCILVGKLKYNCKTKITTFEKLAT